MEEGTFTIEQRPNLSVENAPHFDIYVGAGVANRDSNVRDLGISGREYMVNSVGKKCIIDFNFRPESETGATGCDTAFAKGDNEAICFIENGFNRWGLDNRPTCRRRLFL